MAIETVLLRMGLSLVCGLLIGAEREWRGKPAGMRTITLVCMGSTLMMLVALELHMESNGQASDVIRMMQGIVTGIGFLGAGTVIHSQDRVTGLTTAAAIWMISAIGAAVGAGYYAIAIIGEAFALGLIAVKGKG